MKPLKKYLIMVLCTLFALSAALFAVSCGGDKGTTAEYTVEVYLAEGEDFVLSEENSYQGSGEVGSEVTVTPPDIGGYVFLGEDSRNVTTLTLKEGENVFKLYYGAVQGEAKELYVVYDGNASATANTVRGSMEDAAADETGKVVLAACEFTATGYRFAGWGTRANGKTEYAPGDEITLTEPITLYAIWDRGRTDRFGGSDYIYVPQNENGVVYLERGGVEWKGTLRGDNFTFTLDNGKELIGSIAGSAFEFSYQRAEIAGNYYYYESYIDEEGEVIGRSSTEFLNVEADGSATYIHQNDQGVRETIAGYISYDSRSGYYTFTASRPTAAFEGFVYIAGMDPGDDEIDQSDDVPVFSYTYGEGGDYDEFLTPDGRTGDLGYNFISLDGFGHMYYSSDSITGSYRIEETYDNGSGSPLYRITARISDPYEEFGRGTDFYLYFYTLPLSNGGMAYVESRGDRGVYTAAGETLTLDGFGIFPNSAVYKVGEETHSGRYVFNTSPRTGNSVTFTEVNEMGVQIAEPITFRLLSGNTFERAPEDSGTDYVRLSEGNMFFWPLLTVYSEDYTEGGVQGKRAEMYLLDRDAGTPYLAASGYVTEELQKGGNGVVLYTWHRVRTVKDDANEVKDSLVMLFDTTYDANNNSRNVFMVLEEDETPRYSSYTVLGGGSVRYLNTGSNVLGSVYIDGSGNWYSGGFTLDNTGFIFGSVAYFIYFDSDQRTNFVYFDPVIGTSNDIVGLRLLAEGATEDAGMLVSSTGSMSENATLVMRRNNQAIYDPTGGFLSGAVRGTYEPVGTTATGETLYAFRDGTGVEQFRFVRVYVQNDIGGDAVSYAYYVYNASMDQTLRAADGTTLLIDGCRGAVYTDGEKTEHRGYYTLSADGSALYLDAQGERIVFALSGDSFERLDGLYGEYSFYAEGSEYTLTFDGRGGVTAALNRRPVDAGSYEIVGEDPLEVVLTLDLRGIGAIDYTVSIEGNSCRLFDERTDRVFVSDDWAVITMDGYGSAVYYSADGMRVRSAYVTFLNDNGYARLRYADDSADEYFVFDSEHGTFESPQFFDKTYFYVSSDMYFMIFMTGGNMSYLNTLCSYYLLDGKVYIYVPNASTGGADEVVIDAPDGSSVYSVTIKEGAEQSQKTFYLCNDPDSTRLVQTLSGLLTGTISYTTASGEQASKTASLTFTINLLSYEQDMISATLTVDGQECEVAVCTSYWNSAERRYVRGASIMDLNSYAYYTIQTNFHTEGDTFGGTFTAKGDVDQTLMDYQDYLRFADAYAAANDGRRPTAAEVQAAVADGRIGSITESYDGFGTFVFGDRTIGGRVYSGSDSLTFTGVPSYYIATGDPGSRFFASFVVDGQRYALIYEKEDYGYYNLYMVALYDEFEDGDYIIGINRFFFTTGGFSFYRQYEKGDFCGVEVFKKDGEGRTAVVSFESYAYRNGTAYLVEEKENPDTGYFVTATFENTGADGAVSGKPTGATVKQYRFVQGHNDMRLYSPAYANFFIDEETGEVMLAGLILTELVGDDVMRVIMDIASVEKTDDYHYTVTDVDGSVIQVEVELRDGEPRLDANGEWYVSFVTPEN